MKKTTKDQIFGHLQRILCGFKLSPETRNFFIARACYYGLGKVYERIEFEIKWKLFDKKLIFCGLTPNQRKRLRSLLKRRSAEIRNIIFNYNLELLNKLFNFHLERLTA